MRRLLSLFSKRTMAQTLLEQRRPAQSPQRDPSTLSNYHAFHVNQTNISLNVDWSSHKLAGVVSYDLTAKEKVGKIVLDSSFLQIKNVRVNGNDAKFELSERTEPLGAALTVNSDKITEQSQVDIEFNTTDECTALQWLTPEQTAGKKAPYLFSQCQAIHARSLYPCFDTPSIKSKFNITIQSALPALASGNIAQDDQKTPEPYAKDPEAKLWRFVQDVPIPSYLFAIASGDVDSADIGPRSKVWCEPSQLNACQWEFEADTENIIQAAEKVVFPYQWGTYSVLTLPPSFPYGGMENPNITFATPTLISGDRQNVNVIAHELAHSWSGNLVTNCSWEHFWLNEGWTVYLERRILGALNNEQYRQFHAIIGWQELEHAVKSLTEKEHEGYTQLVVDLQDQQDPDDAFSTVPYEKGFNFLYMLECTLGKEAWDKFIPHYFTQFKGKSLDSYQFRDAVYEFFQDQKETLDKVDWDAWYFNPGLPPKPHFDTTLADACYALADKWEQAIKQGLSKGQLCEQFSADDMAPWTSLQSCVFVDTLTGKFDTLGPSPQLAIAADALNEIYKLASSNNPEVISRWYRLAIPAQLESQYVPLANWLGTVGRMKFVRGSFKLLNKADRGLAVSTFEKNRDFYHPICRTMVAKDLGL